MSLPNIFSKSASYEIFPGLPPAIRFFFAAIFAALLAAISSMLCSLSCYSRCWGSRSFEVDSPIREAFLPPPIWDPISDLPLELATLWPAFVSLFPLDESRA
jgi:hypothetical protein